MMQSRVQIVATIGPASGTEETVAKLLSLGMDVARINFSHGTHESNGGYITAIRAAAQKAGKRVPVILDLAGPRGKTAEGHAFDSQKSEITEKDLADLEYGISRGVEYIAQSYVGNATDVEAMRGEIQKRLPAQAGGAHIPIIAKIERAEAVANIDEIVRVADAIMIARGDLGEAVPIEQIPFIEKDVIAKCNAAGKPVITATQMMSSMTKSPAPTRAEVTDVAYAVVEGSDAVMLSEETALGEYPEETVAAMEKISLEAERHVPNHALRAL